MYLSDAVRERIKFYQKKNGMSLWALFKASGVPISTLAAFMSKRTELNYFIFVKDLELL